jgi:proline iminopeptidase
MELFPEIDAYDTGFLKVSDLHNLYYDQSGNPTGNPVLYLHGGPGGGCSTSDRRYFDPKVYRIILLDQRGSGKSTPSAELRDNDTWALIGDIEKLRVHLKIEKWVVFGGSWGSTLSLTYAIEHSSRVTALILRGIFTLRHSELQWFYQEGAHHIYPDIWETYESAIPKEERGDMIRAYYKRLTGNDEAEKLKCAKAWSAWECSTSKLYIDKKEVAKADSDIFALAFARIECHYFVNKGFFKDDGWILNNVHRIKHIPAVIVQGRYDIVCPCKTAWDLHRKWPEAEFHMIADSGHSAKEVNTTKKLIEAAIKFQNL